MARDRGPLEALVDDRRRLTPSSRPRRWSSCRSRTGSSGSMKQGGRQRAPGDGDRRGARRPLAPTSAPPPRSACRSGPTTTCTVRWRRWKTASPTPAPRTTTRCSRRRRCSGCRSCSPGWAASTRPSSSRSSASTSPNARSTRWSWACRSPRSRRSRWPAATSTEAEQYAHRALLLQRLSGYHWAAGLFLPALAHRATSPRASTSRRATRSPRGRRPADEHGAGQRRPLLAGG